MTFATKSLLITGFCDQKLDLLLLKANLVFWYDDYETKVHSIHGVCGSTYFYGVKDMSFKYDELHIGLHGFRACSAKTWSISCGLKLVENLVKEVHFHTKNYLI